MSPRLTRYSPRTTFGTDAPGPGALELHADTASRTAIKSNLKNTRNPFPDETRPAAATVAGPHYTLFAGVPVGLADGPFSPRGPPPGPRTNANAPQDGASVPSGKRQAPADCCTITVCAGIGAGKSAPRASLITLLVSK